MTENKKLNDEMMENVAGGVKLDEHGMPKYDGFGKVTKSLGDQNYIVQREDGVEITAHYAGDKDIPVGTEVALIMLMGGWAMEEIRAF